MPDTTEEQKTGQEKIVESPTSMAAKLKADTEAAIKGVAGSGFDDPEFDESLQAAIDKDLGKKPESKAPEQVADPEKKPDEKPANRSKSEPDPKPEDIPAELFGEKPKDAAPAKTEEESKAESDRQKFIEEQTKGMTPKAAERFKKIELRAYDAEQRARKISEERESEKAALQKQIDALKIEAAAKKEDPAEVSALKKQLEEMESVVARTSLAEDPRFKAAFDGKIAAEIEKVKKLVPSENAEELSQLFAIPESKKRNDRITEIVESLSGIQQTKVLAALERVDGLATEKAAQLANWKENKVHVEARTIREREEDQARNAEIQKVAWSKGMEAVSSPENGLEIFRKVGGNEDWNSAVDERAAKVKKILSQNLKPEDIVELAARAVGAGEYRNLFLAQRMLVKKLNEELSALKTAEPDPGDDTGDVGDPEDRDDFVTAAAKSALKGGVLRG